MNDQDARSDRTLIGRVLGGKFRLRSYIGAGSSGTVFKADQTALGRTVAVKILNPDLAVDTRLVSRFHDEALAASRLNHPNTVSVIDYGQTEDGLLYLVMEYLRGVTLTQIIAEESPMSEERIVDIISQVLSGLEEAHEAGVVHADLKSDNIVVERRRGGWYLVKVVDFGIARLLGVPPAEEDERTICGTPEYMAPEVISGHDPTFASDLYAVGVILYEMLSCETPFVGGSSLEVLTRHLRQDPVPPSARRPDLPVSPMVEQMALRALSKHPDDRFPTATDFRLSLEPVDDRALQETDEQVLCNSCGMYSAATFKFCPECGHPRMAVMETGLLDTMPNLVIGDDGAYDPQRAALLGIMSDAEEDVASSLFPLPLVGRHEQLELLSKFVDDDGPHLMVLSGIVGSGRSRLLHMLQERLEPRQDIVVYRASADPTGLRAPLYPIRQIVAAVLALPPVCPYNRLNDGLEILGLSRRDLPGIAELFGHHGELWQLDPEVRRRELFASALRVLKASATDLGKAVFLFSDVERYDQPSRELLYRIAVLDRAESLRVIMTQSSAPLPANPAQMPEAYPFASDVEWEADGWPQSAARVILNPLSDDDLMSLVVHIEQSGREGLPAAEQMAELTDGNPQHLNHLMRFLVEGGRLEQVPPTLADLVATRIDILPQDARILCQAAAVFGDEVARDTLRHTLGKRLSGVGFKTALSVAMARGLLREIGAERATIGFAHTLVREVFYDATPANVRRELHADAIRSLKPISSDPLVLGHHHEMTENLSEAASMLMRAGDDAVHQLDDMGAIDLYRRALAASRRLMLRDDDDKNRLNFVTLSVKLADALRVGGDFVLARGVIEEAVGHSRGSPSLEAQLLQASAHLYAGEENFTTAIDKLRNGIGLVIRDGDKELLAELYLDLSSMYLRKGEPDVAIAELSEGLNMVTMGEGAEAKSGPQILWRMLFRMAHLYYKAENLRSAVIFAKNALRHARRIRSRIGSARVQSLLASFYEAMGNLRRAEDYREAAVKEMRRLGDRRATAELLLSGVVPTRTLMRINPATLREARELADEIGWAEGVEQASEKTNQIKDL